MRYGTFIPTALGATLTQLHQTEKSYGISRDVYTYKLVYVCVCDYVCFWCVNFVILLYMSVYLRGNRVKVIWHNDVLSSTNAI